MVAMKKDSQVLWRAVEGHGFGLELKGRFLSEADTKHAIAVAGFMVGEVDAMTRTVVYYPKES